MYLGPGKEVTWAKAKNGRVSWKANMMSTQMMQMQQSAAAQEGAGRGNLSWRKRSKHVSIVLFLLVAGLFTTIFLW